MLSASIVSLTHMTKLFLKGMVERKSGKIMNVASWEGFTLMLFTMLRKHTFCLFPNPWRLS